MSKLITFEKKSYHRGNLTFLEEAKEIPFNIKRVYYLHNTAKGVSRGFHAHKKLEQIAICVAGSCEIILDDGFNRETFLLDTPDVGLYIGNYVWREIHNFSSDCVLLVLASTKYEENDYIRDYQIFMAEVQNGKK